MPERATDKRNQERQQLAAQRDQLVEGLRENDWVERLAANADFKRFSAAIAESNLKNLEELEQYKSALFSQPMDPAQAAKTRDLGLLTQGTIDGIREVLMWPVKLAEKLREDRARLPGVEKRLAELTEREEVPAHG